MTSKMVYCVCCRYATLHSLIKFSKKGEKSFTEKGFNNWRKAIAKFSVHGTAQFHREAHDKWLARGMTAIKTQLSFQLAAQQIKRRHGLLHQLRANVFLTRQGISIRGHSESEGNFFTADA